MSLNILREYLNAIAANLKAGNATEHTHRPALKTLLEAIGAQADGGQAQGAISATNEPQRIACGAPDFIVTRGLLPLGYVEAKDVGVSLDKTASTEQLTMASSTAARTARLKASFFRFFSILSPAESTK